jgi:exosortase C (VPDSG-CTERM-specific)
MNKPDGAFEPLQSRGSLAWFVWASAVLLLCFSRALYQLARYSLTSELYSYILIVPAISGYLAWLKLKAPVAASAPARTLAVVLLVAGLVALGFYGAKVASGEALAPVDALAYSTLSLVLLFGAVCGFCLGREMVRALAFPLGFLVFMVPFPDYLIGIIDDALQHGSATVAHWMFEASGTPQNFSDLTFRLPGITIMVAPECSGIHSTLALLITSLVAGYLFLRSPWSRSVLALAVIPLALLRNGFRIYVVGELCAQIGPEMINSYIHRHGGPIFFALSLIPFFLLLLLLVRRERPAAKSR